MTTSPSKIKIPPPSKPLSAIVNPDPDKFEVNRFLHTGRLICRETWLPAYKDRAEYNAHAEKYFPGMTVENSWRCVHCGYWHFIGYFPRNTNKGKGAKGKV